VLYFTHFSQLTRDQFETELARILRTDESLYRQAAHDIYGQGVVLGRRKYRLLRWSYLAFLSGLFVTAIAAIARVVTI